MKKLTLGILVTFLCSGCAGFIDLLEDSGSRPAFYNEEPEQEYNDQVDRRVEADSFDPYANRFNQLSRVDDQVRRSTASIQRPGDGRVQTAILSNDIVLGMNASQVIDSWGEPTYVEFAGDRENGNERWIYGPRYRLGKERIIIFENGRVAGWYR